AFRIIKALRVMHTSPKRKLEILSNSANPGVALNNLLAKSFPDDDLSPPTQSSRTEQSKRWSLPKLPRPRELFGRNLHLLMHYTTLWSTLFPICVTICGLMLKFQYISHLSSNEGISDAASPYTYLK